MGHHHHHHHQFHHFLQHGGSKKEQQVLLPPKGCMAVRVGRKEEEQERFVVPVAFLNHPLFVGLLKEAEEEYGFEHRGAITLPCHVDHFRQVLQGIVHRDSGYVGGAGRGHDQGHNHHNHQHHHLHFHLYGCFKASS